MTRSLLHAAAVAALFVGALLANLRANGTSPIAWSDTFNDEFAVQRCVAGDGCTLVGVGTSIAGLFHAVGWLQWRSFLAWLGLGLDGVHIVLQLLNALAIALLFDLATQLGGRLAGTIAVWLMVFSIGTLSVQHAALYNSTPLLFLGTILLIACTAVVEHPSLPTVALAALVAAVLANVHAACIVAGASVVWAALLAPTRRWYLAAFGVVLFVCATVIIGPPGWMRNVARLVQHAESASSARGVAHQAYALIVWSFFGVGAWAASWRAGGAGSLQLRRRSQGALAVLVPMLSAFLIAPMFDIDASAKYLAHVAAAAALVAALPLARLLRSLRRRMERARDRVWEKLPTAERALPFVLAVLMPFTATATDRETPRCGDLAAATRILRQRGWSMQHLTDSLKTPRGMTVLTGIQQLDAVDDVAGGHAMENGENALLLTFATADLPEPLPPHWFILRRSGGVATVLIISRSQLDWSRFEICTSSAESPEPRCRDSGLRFVPDAFTFGAANMPTGGPWRGTLTVRVPLRSRPGEIGEEIFMPRMGGVCGGVIASPSSDGVRITADRRRATLSDTRTATIDLEWQVGSPDCDDGSYDGLPPFVIAGDPTTVELIATILHKHEVD